MPTHDLKKSVVLFVGSLEIGGTERNVLHLARTLLKRGFRVEVWCDYAGQPMEQELRAADVPCGSLKQPSLGRHPLVRLLKYNLPYQLRLARLLFRHRRSAMIAFGFPMAYYVILLGRLVGARRVFFTVQDWDVWKRSPVYKWLDRLCSRLALGVLCDGEGARRMAIREQGMLSCRTRTLYDGVDVTELRPVKTPAQTRREMGLSSRRVTVGVVARLDTRKKGQDVFLQALPLIRKRTTSGQFLIVGDGPDRATLESLSAGLPGNAQPKFAGARRDLADVLHAVDILVIPSRWESVPKILLEGMWCERAIVAARVGDIEEILDEQTGVLIPPDDPQALADAVCGLLTNPKRRRRLGTSARAALIARGLTLDHSVQRYEALFLNS